MPILRVPSSLEPVPRQRPLVGLLALVLVACSSSGGSTAPPAAQGPELPDFSLATFSSPTSITNAFFGLVPDTAKTLVSVDGDDRETIVIEALGTTRVVMGVTCAVVRDRVYADGLLIEDTHDWYCQDDAGNVWYMGEAVDNYEYDPDGNLLGIDHDGSWEAGLDINGAGEIAKPGHVMKAAPQVGDYYYQEFYRGEAEDIGRVLALNVPVTLSDGTAYLCLKTEDTSSLTSDVEHKYYAPGLGFVYETKPGSAETVEFIGRFDRSEASLPDFQLASFSAPTVLDNGLFPAHLGEVQLLFSEEESETIVLEFLTDTRTVMGVECAILRDRVYADGLLVEDTRDWFCQDDAGNVWYMGEEVDNYEYDEDGNLIGINHDGSWEAGLDIAGVGHIALPGYQMLAAPTAGAVYYQEFYEEEAEDMGLVNALDVDVQLEDGTEYEGCVRILDWNPLDPDGLEYKYFAPDEGLVLEEALHEEKAVARLGQFTPGRASVPDVGLATFTLSTLVDNPFQPLPSGATWEYEAETEDGLETILVEVLPQLRVVMGIDCVVVRDRVWLEGLLIEDTHDWFAQDDDGNVWYMGEAVVNYHYDTNGNLLGTDTDGSWEAGLDVAGVGSIALPGFQMQAASAIGDSYHQEWYLEEAEDMARVIATDLTVELASGDEFSGCLQTLDWNPLEPDVLEYKFYAPGVGLILERKLNDDERVELTDTSL